MISHSTPDDTSGSQHSGGKSMTLAYTQLNGMDCWQLSYNHEREKTLSSFQLSVQDFIVKTPL